MRYLCLLLCIVLLIPAICHGQPPASRQFIYDVSITQVAPLVIEVNWKCAEEKAKSCLEYLTPQGKTVKTKWLPASIGARKAGFSSHTRIIEIASAAGIGTYRIKVKARGSRGQKSQTEFRDFVLFGAQLWQLRASSITATSCLLQWERFPRPGRFAGYQIKIDGKPAAQISSIETVSYPLENLAPKTAYLVELTAQDASGAVLTAPASLSVTSLSLPPIISNVQGIPEYAGANQHISVAAQINDDDSAIKKVELSLSGEKEKRTLTQQQFDSRDVPFSFGFNLSLPGSYELTLTAYDEATAATVQRKIEVLGSERPRIAFEKFAAGVYANRQCALDISVLNKEKLAGDLVLDLDWGDGMIQSIDAQTGKNVIPVAHTYQSEGAFNITARLSSKSGKALLASEPVSASVSVQALPPTAELIRKPAKTSTQQFRIKAAKGSYSIASWALSFGDGSAPLTGEGDVEQEIEHSFNQPTGRIPGTDTIQPAYEVKFTVTDSSQNTVTRIVAVEVAKDQPSP